MEGQGGGGHIAAVGAAHHRHLVVGHPRLLPQPFAAGDDVAQIGLAVALVVHVEEGLAIAGTAPVVGAQHSIAVVHQVLDHGRIAATGLAARPAVHQDDGWGGMGGGRPLGR